MYIIFLAIIIIILLLYLSANSINFQLTCECQQVVGGPWSHQSPSWEQTSLPAPWSQPSHVMSGPLSLRHSPPDEQEIVPWAQQWLSCTRRGWPRDTGSVRAWWDHQSCDIATIVKVCAMSINGAPLMLNAVSARFHLPSPSLPTSIFHISGVYPIL